MKKQVQKRFYLVLMFLTFTSLLLPAVLHAVTIATYNNNYSPGEIVIMNGYELQPSPLLSSVTPITQVTTPVYSGAGGDVTFNYTITRDNSAGAVAGVVVSISGLPAGVTVSSGLPVTVTIADGESYSSSFVLSVDNTVAANSYGFTIGANGPDTDDATGTGDLVVTACPTPDISCPSISPVDNTTGACSVSVEFTATSTDDPAPTFTYSTLSDGAITSPYTFNVGETTVTVTATNSCGETATCDFTVTVNDTEDPSITCAEPAASYDADQGECFYTVNGTELDPTNTDDNCGVASVINDFNNLATLGGAEFPVGTTTVVWTVTDVHDRTSTCSFDIVVVDNQDPSITCAEPAASYDADQGECFFTVSGTALDPTATDDNCGVAIVVNNFNDAATLDGAEFPVGTTPVIWTVTDVHGRTSTCSFDIVVVDNQDPSITCATVNESYNADQGVCFYTVSGTALDPTATDDNCGVASVINDFNNTASLDGAEFQVGSTTVVWTVTDLHGRTSTCTYDLVVMDNQAPVIISCPTPETSYDTDAGLCTKSLSFEATATDNCGIESIKYYIGVDEITFPYDFPFGTSTVQVVVTDTHTNTSGCSFDVVVDHVTTTLVVVVSTDPSTDPVTQQYSDMVTLTATLTPWNCELVDCTANGTVEFTIGNQIMGTAVLIDGVATLNTQMCGDFNTALTLGAFDVSAVYTPGDCDKYLGDTDVCEGCLTIEKEIACADYSGVLFASTPSPSSDKFTVVLAATVREKYTDGTYCDIRKALVDFYNGTTRLNSTPVPVGLIDPEDNTVGTAVYEWTSGLPTVGYETYQINIKIVGEYYEGVDCNGTYTPVTVSKPMGEFITGGGYLVLTNSNGIKKGDFGSKNNFGFNVKWNKSMKNLQGNINTIIRRTETDGYLHSWQVKGNVMSSLTVNAATKEATFTGKASISDVTDPTDKPGIIIGSGDGNATLQVIMKDVAEPGKDLDLLGITVWNKAGGVWYSSNWDGKRTVSQTIAKGNLSVHPSVIKSDDISGPIAIEKAADHFNLEVYPNPSSGPVTFALSLPADSKVTLDIYSVTGKRVTRLYDGTMQEGACTIKLDRQLPNGVYMYKLQSGETVKSGRLIINNNKSN